MILKLLVAALTLTTLPAKASAQTFTCAVSNSIPYCVYTGKLKHVYINIDNVMLFYFEQTIDTALPASVGYTGISSGIAGAFTATDNPVFAEYFYSTALTAFAADKTVTIQMRETVGGYLKVDRIWLQ